MLPGIGLEKLTFEIKKAISLIVLQHYIFSLYQIILWDLNLTIVLFHAV